MNNGGRSRDRRLQGQAGRQRHQSRGENLLVEGGTDWCNRGRMSAHADKSGDSPTPLNQNLPKPYLKPCGTLVIPMAGDPKYHYWKQGGQSVYKTLEELQEKAES